MKIDVRITEILTRVVTIEAEDENSATAAVDKIYKDGKIVLDYTDFDGNVSIEIDKQVNEL